MLTASKTLPPQLPIQSVGDTLFTGIYLTLPTVVGRVSWGEWAISRYVN